MAKTRRKRNADRLEYGVYVSKIAKAVNKERSLSSGALTQINDVAEYLIERMAKKAADVAHFKKKATTDASCIKAAASILFPGRLRADCVGAGSNAVLKYASRPVTA